MGKTCDVGMKLWEKAYEYLQQAKRSTEDDVESAFDKTRDAYEEYFRHIDNCSECQSDED